MSGQILAAVNVKYFGILVWTTCSLVKNCCFYYDEGKGRLRQVAPSKRRCPFA